MRLLGNRFQPAILPLLRSEQLRSLNGSGNFYLMGSGQLCRSILVAEDNNDVRETIVDAIRMQGYEVHGVSNGKQALEMLDVLGAPTLVLLDLMMPVMNGWEFLNAQCKRAKLASHKIVTISAVDPTRGPVGSSPIGAAGNLQKPISLDDLWDTVREFCGEPGAAHLPAVP